MRRKTTTTSSHCLNVTTAHRVPGCGSNDVGTAAGAVAVGPVAVSYPSPCQSPTGPGVSSGDSDDDPRMIKVAVNRHDVEIFIGGVIAGGALGTGVGIILGGLAGAG